jgi:hypothetical protein
LQNGSFTPCDTALFGRSSAAFGKGKRPGAADRIGEVGGRIKVVRPRRGAFLGRSPGVAVDGHSIKSRRPCS